MKVIRATQQMLETRTLVLGFQGENLRTQLRVDCSPTFAEYPNATPALAIKPPSGETYPVFVERDGNEVVWDIVANNLVLKGDGELQLTFYKGNVIAKTSIGHITVNRSLQIDGEMPDVVATWIENANRKLAEVDAQIVELEGMVDTATDAATRAEQSASIASTKAEQAAGSAATATEKATEATNAAGTATAKAAEAALSATQANNSAVSAADSERRAIAKAGDAITAAGTATAKATEATEAAQTATEKAGDASASATAAHASEINAAESADDALSAEVGANAAKRAAEASATQASISEQNAGTAAQTATQKAAEATQSATNATTFAGTATTKAEEAAASAQAAQDAKTVVAETAEQLAESLEQIAQNTQDIAELDERKANIDGYYPDMTVGNAEQLNSSKFVENSEPYTLRTSGGTSDIGNREYLDAVVGGTVAWNQMVRDEASENETDFAPIVTVTDAVEDAAGVKVKIEPVQDLHGYDHPWPAGGGENLLYQPDAKTATHNGITWSANANGSITIAGTATADSLFYYIPNNDGVGPELNGNYRYRNFPFSDTSALSCGILIGDKWFSGYGNTTVSLNNASGQLHQLWYRVVSGTTINITIFPIIYKADATLTSWSPYANICPITGHTDVTVTRMGANLFNSETAEASRRVSIANGNIYGTIKQHASDYISVKPEMTYTINFSYYSSGDFGMAFYDKDKTFVSGIKQSSTTSSSTTSFTFNVPADCYFLRFSNEDDIRAIDAITLVPGSVAGTDTAYTEPQTVTVDWASEAGTVYGGSLTIAEDGSGVLTVDRAEMVITGEEESIREYRVSPTNFGNYYCSIVFRTFPQTPSTAWDFVSNMLIKTASSFVGMGVNTGRFQTNNLNFTLCIAGLTTAEEYEAWIKQQATDGHPLTIVHELNTATTYNLTASQIRTLLGENNIWADTGDLALTYTGTDEHLVLESGKKYLARISGTDSMLLGSGQEITAAKGTDNVFDLTQMFGTAVADYVYGQGASFFRKWFGGSHYPYNAGELLSVEGLQSHDMVGFNQWDEQWELGYWIDGHTKGGSSYNICCSTPIPVFPSTTYYCKSPYRYGLRTFCLDADRNIISDIGYVVNNTFTTPADCRFIVFYTNASDSVSSYNGGICISLAHNGSRNGEYEPYEKHSYPLDSSVILRGIPKVGANGVYWDGDRYLPDGTVERRYGVVDLGTLNWQYNAATGYLDRFVTSDIASTVARKDATMLNLFCSKFLPDPSPVYARDKNNVMCVLSSTGNLYISATGYADAASFKAAMSGVLLVYELATPTTETAQPYHSTQWVSDWGTEEFVSTGIVPVGHETRYPANLRDKLQHLPDAASGNGSYLITQTDGQMVLTPFPAPPSTAGNYVLKATVVNGVATYTWEVAT